MTLGFYLEMGAARFVTVYRPTCIVQYENKSVHTNIVASSSCRKYKGHFISK